MGPVCAVCLLHPRPIRGCSLTLTLTLTLTQTLLVISSVSSSGCNNRHLHTDGETLLPALPICCYFQPFCLPKRLKNQLLDPILFFFVVLQVTLFEAEFGLVFVRTGLAVKLAVAPLKPFISMQNGETSVTRQQSGAVGSVRLNINELW